MPPPRCFRLHFGDSEWRFEFSRVRSPGPSQRRKWARAAHPVEGRSASNADLEPGTEGRDANSRYGSHANARETARRGEAITLGLNEFRRTERV